ARPAESARPGTPLRSFCRPDPLLRAFCRPDPQAGGALQFRDLLWSQVAAVGGGDVGIVHRTDADPLQADDGVADRVEHLPHLALPPLVDRDLDDRPLAALPYDPLRTPAPPRACA